MLRPFPYYHASPVRDARLPSDSGKTQSHFVGLGLLPSLQSIRAAHDGSDAQMICFSPSMDTSFSQAALSAPSSMVPLPFTGGEKDLYT